MGKLCYITILVVLKPNKLTQSRTRKAITAAPQTTFCKKSDFYLMNSKNP